MSSTASEVLQLTLNVVSETGVVTGTGYKFMYGFVPCIVLGYEFSRLVCLISLFYVLF